MPVYEYRSVDEKGNVASGRMEEPSAKHVAALLHERGLQASSIEEVDRPKGFLPRKRPLRADELAMLNEQLVAIAKDGLPMAPSLKAMASDLRNPRMRRVLEQIYQDLEMGASLGEALSKHPESFPPDYRTLIRAGEESGNLYGVLELLSESAHRRVELRKRLIEVFTYPIFILVISYYVMVYLMTDVIPSFAEVFYDFDALLPWLTTFWVNVSGVFIDYALFLNLLPPIVAALIIGGYWYARRTPRVGLYLDRVKNLIPVVGRVSRARRLSRFSWTLGLMLASRVPLIEGLDLSAAASGDYALRNAVRGAARDVAQGTPVSDALENSRYFNNTFCWMVGNAERRGDLSETMLNLAEIHEREAQRMERWATTIISPILIIIMALIVLTVALSIYVPIFGLADSLSG